jgi:hypothetical protein
MEEMKAALTNTVARKIETAYLLIISATIQPTPSSNHDYSPA